MTAAGLVQKYPELVEPLRDGRLHLTSLVELSKVLTSENLADVLPRFFHASKREAQEVRAALLPAEAPPRRTIVTSVPAPEPALQAAIVHAPFTRAVLPEEPRACQLSVPDVARPSVKPASGSAAVEPLTDDLRRLHVTVSRRLLDKLAAARDALSHSHPGATEETILELGLDLIIERHRKRRGIGRKPRNRASTSTSTSTFTTMFRGAEADRQGASAAPTPPRLLKRSRHVPADVSREVWERDAGECQWPLEGGGICASTHQVEVDHVDGWARGGATTSERCRLLCRFHQDVAARRMYGDATMDRFTRPKGSTCSEPVAPYLAVSRGPRAGSGAGPSRRERRGSPARYFANATFSRRSFSSRVPMDRRMQPSRPL